MRPSTESRSRLLVPSMRPSKVLQKLMRARRGPLEAATLDAPLAGIPILWYGRDDTCRDAGMELRRMGRPVLSERDPASRFPDDLRARLRHRRSRFHLLRDAGSQDSTRL